MIGRIVIDDPRPRTPGRYPAKAVIGESVRVSADVFRDGHDILAARVQWRPAGENKWRDAPMEHLGNDRWEAVIEPTTLGLHELVVEAWTDRLATLAHDIEVKEAAGEPVDVELQEVDLEQKAQQEGKKPADITRSEPLPLWVDRERALFGAWYELFPRSEGGLKRAARTRLPDVAAMGFDIVYLPPVHPVGRSHRKGPNNTLTAGKKDPGSPWAIGNELGGHTALEPSLGTMEDFDAFVAAAEKLGMEVALDYALQCSPDHPWVTEHPEWFHRRPDGSIKYAENPPKKYQDIYPINFWPADDKDRQALWQACKEILDFWIGHGVRIFRVDNPHTKPLAFWEWVIPEIQKTHPETLFLAEAFTRPKMMAKLAEVGFSQSYTYFTWRNTRDEFVEYLEELAQGPKADYMRPNFWPNTPDILSGPLRNGPPSAFRLRLLLAATMVPSYGMYSGYELYENEPASPGNEEYLHSEKYEIKRRDWQRSDSLAPFVTKLNDIRRRHPAFAELRNIRFHQSSYHQILVWSKVSGDDRMLIVANLDPHSWHEDTIQLDLGALGLPADAPIQVYDELTGASWIWYGAAQYVRLDPLFQPGHVLHLTPLTAPPDAL
ncbi:MAG TPA: alpha-1,4-glucan--maltose-1-phosphate maltosyltransferase [Acidimicrobiales bacterium]|nr:alpha-1,4-glucan--maltose-1-phosphate maltosyltransferase [Acidimicrobiales bacterium]